MILFIAIGVFVLAALSIAYLAGRKFVYLRKLTPEAINDPPPTMSTFWSGLFPEIASFLGRFNWREYRVRITAGSEKLLRRMRLIFLKIDSITHSLINRLRRSTKRHEAIINEEEAQKEMVEKAEIPIAPPRDPKEEEQHLIMEVAKDPKDPLLYLRLGDIYLKTGELDNARMSFETALQLDPQNWYARKKVAELKPE